MLGVFLLVGSLLPLAAMMIALFAAAWMRDGRRATAPAGRQPCMDAPSASGGP